LLKAEEKGIAITGMLSRAGIRLERYAEIQQAHIEEFRSRAKAYSELQNDLALLRQRENGLDKSLAELFKRAVSIYGADFGSSTLLLDELGRMGRTVESRKEQLKLMKTELEENCAARGMALPVPEFMTDENFVTQKDIVTVEYEKVEEKATELRLKTVELETLLKDRADEGNELQEIDEEIYELEEKKVQLEDKHFSIKTALDTLTEASAEIQRDFAPVLNQKMSTAISRITGNRYADLRADDSLALKVLVPETGEVADNLMLSGGTVDQLYLALRVAMAEIIASSQEKLPFVMDEVFAQYDDQRVCNTFEFLQELSSERQVILFTCKSREEDMAARVFSGNINVLELR
jgi:uncharacterized protein YhaN